MSAIDVGTSIVVADSVTKGLFGTGAWSFFTDGWLGRSNPATSGSSSAFSLYEITTGILGFPSGLGSSPPQGTYGVWPPTATSQGMTTAEYFAHQVKTNFEANGGKMITTVIAVPILAKMGKKLLAKPLINPVNRVLKNVGISQAMGVKL